MYTPKNGHTYVVAAPFPLFLKLAPLFWPKKGWQHWPERVKHRGRVIQFIPT